MLYEYYNTSEIKSGLCDDQSYFTLNGKKITLLGGALHYFRVPQEYWPDRIRKFRAAGLNTVETYIPWNLHEPKKGVYCFGKDSSDYHKLLDIRKFLEIVKQEDLFAIVRPGPYICAEWEFGGMPSWLLRDPTMKLRTSDERYVKHFKEYFKALLKVLVPLQFTKGGPIIAYQIENEYANTRNSDQKYLEIIKKCYAENGVVELLFTSDTPSSGWAGTLPGVLATANFDAGMDIKTEMSLIKKHQPDKPLMIMEYWSGWYDHWTKDHHVRNPEKVCQVYEDLLKIDASVNIYMFFGGSNWGFLNGGNFENDEVDNSGYMSTISSYDYDAPLAENGDYTEKYFKIKEIISKYNTCKTKIPDMPELVRRIVLPTESICGELCLQEILSSVSNVVESECLISMEMLPINDGNGQSYGYIIYRKDGITIAKNSKLIIEGHVCDTVMVLINGKLTSKILKNKDDLNGFGYWRLKNSSLELGSEEYINATLDLVVENWGRANFGKFNQFNQKKGLWQGDVLLNENVIKNWKIYPLEFNSEWILKMAGWRKPTFSEGPTLYRAVVNVQELRDTYLDMREWGKGLVIVNGFVLSRYLHLGPQQTAYLPAPILRVGNNEVLIFEHFTPSKTIKFCADPIFNTKH